MNRTPLTCILMVLTAAISIGQTTAPSNHPKAKAPQKPAASQHKSASKKPSSPVQKLAQSAKNIAKATTKGTPASRKPGTAAKEAPKTTLPPAVPTPDSLAKALQAPLASKSSAPASPPVQTTTQPAPATTTPAPAATTGSDTTPQTPTTATPRTPRVKSISNVFTDTDIKVVVQELANASGAQVIADTSVKGMELNIEFKKDTIESALDKLSLATGILWKKKGEIYIISTGSPEAPLFSEFAETRIYTPHTQPAENLYALLTRSFITYAQLDKAANLISVTAPPKQMESIWKSLTAADTAKKQFAVEALVTQMDDQSIKTAGFSWNWRYFAQGSDLSLTYATASAADLVTIKAMITNNTAELRANPKVIATEGHEASLTVGNENYFAMEGGNPAYPSVQYQKITTGITLKFTGYIEADGMVNLHLQPEISDAVVLVNGNPQTTIRKADTYMRIKFGDTVALGGMVVQNTIVHNNKVPILGDIPILGNAFKSTSREKDRTEVVILITPRLIQQN